MKCMTVAPQNITYCLREYVHKAIYEQDERYTERNQCFCDKDTTEKNKLLVQKISKTPCAFDVSAFGSIETKFAVSITVFQHNVTKH